MYFSRKKSNVYSRCYHEAFSNLAAAIINDGIRCNDTKFLESNWCECLRYMCKLDDMMYGNLPNHQQDISLNKSWGII